VATASTTNPAAKNDTVRTVVGVGLSIFEELTCLVWRNSGDSGHDDTAPGQASAAARVCHALLSVVTIRRQRELIMIDITPNGTGLPGIEQLRVIVGAVMTLGLILSVLALIVAAIMWGFGANSSNPHLASRGKVGVLVACGAAIICGSAVTLVNFFWNVGQTV
jgi:hypothetical protein